MILVRTQRDCHSLWPDLRMTGCLRIKYRGTIFDHDAAWFKSHMYFISRYQSLAALSLTLNCILLSW